MGVKTYNPKLVSVIIGAHIAEGFADGQFVNVVRNSNEFELTVGTSGEGCRAKSNNLSGEIRVSFMQSSISNDILSAYAASGATFPFLIRDNNGTSLEQCVTAWVKKRPDVGFDRVAVNREWILESDEIIGLQGGI